MADLILHLPEGHEELLKHTVGRRATRIYLRPTERLGRSRAKVYSGYLTSGSEAPLNGEPFYAKIGAADDINNEHQLCDELGFRIRNCAKPVFGEKGGLGCILMLKAGNREGHASPLAYYLGREHSGTTWDSVCKALEHLYTCVCEPWRNSTVKRSFSWFEEYARYLRWKATSEFITEWLADSAILPSIESCAGAMRNPYVAIEDLKSLSSEGTARPVHGDLHQRNIILVTNDGEQGAHPWLIDFAWGSHEFHAMADYALLEASLKVFHFARFFSESEYVQLHQELDSPDSGHPQVDEALTSHDPRMFCRKLIRTIRREAQKESRGLWPREYYLSSLMITMGLISVPECNVHRALLASAWFANEVQPVQ